MKKILAITSLCCLLAGTAAVAQTTTNQTQDCSSFTVNEPGYVMMKKSCKMSLTVEQGMKRTWEVVIRSSLFKRINLVGLAAGAVGILWWMVKFLPEAFEKSFHVSCFKEAIRPVAIMMLFGDPVNYGSLFGTLILEANTLTHAVERVILLSINDDYTNKHIVRSTLSAVTIKISAITLTDNAIRNCSQLNSHIPKVRCFYSAYEDLEALLRPFFTRKKVLAIIPIGHQENWAKKTFEIQTTRLEKAAKLAGINWDAILSQPTIISSKHQRNKSLKLRSSNASKTALTTMFVTGTAFLYGLEAVGIITALLGGFSLGLSLFPASRPAILGWLGAMGGIWMARFSYKLLVILASMFVIETPLAIAPALFANLVGVFGVIIALAMGAGGGLAIITSMGGLINFVLPKK